MNFNNALLKKFCESHEISLNKLSELCGGNENHASKSTIHRLVNNRLEKKYARNLRLTLAQNLPNHLLMNGFAIETVNKELSEIFTKEEFLPMITKRIELPAKVQRHFGLSADPFGINLNNVSEVFVWDELRQIFDRIIDAIQYQGFVAVTGNIGAGKTVLKSWIEETVSNNNSLEIIFQENFDTPKITPNSVARSILEHFNYRKIPIDGGSKTRAVKRLLAERSKNTSVAIAFDECHKLNPQTLSSLKNFLEMNSGGFRRYLGVVLFGQPAFETNLNESREIAERMVLIRIPVFGYSVNEKTNKRTINESAIKYLHHRIALVGGNADEFFDNEAKEIIALNSDTPLQMGNIANQAMINASQKPYESKKVLGGILRATMTFANLKSSRSLKAVN